MQSAQTAQEGVSGAHPSLSFALDKAEVSFVFQATPPLHLRAFTVAPVVAFPGGEAK